MEELKLLGTWASPYSYRVLWALEHKGVKYEYVEEDLLNKSELLLKYNPIHKKIPVLVHSGKPIVVVSIVILEYIEDIWPQNPLLPQDPYQRTLARFWIKFGEDKGPIFYKFFHTVGEQVKATKEVEEVLKTIEERGLKDNKFFGGEKLGLTDIAYGWIACWFDVLVEAAGAKLLGLENFPRLQAWAENFKQVPFIKDSLPDRHKMLSHFKSRRDKIIAATTY